MATLREQLMERLRDSNDGFFKLGMQIVPGFTRKINPINYFGLPVTFERYDEKVTSMPDAENYDEKDVQDEQECLESQNCGLKISAFWSENDKIRATPQTTSENDDTNTLSDISESLNWNEQDVSNKNVPDVTVKPVDTVADIKYAGGSNSIVDNITAPLFSVRSKNMSPGKADIPAVLDNCLTNETIPDTAGLGSSYPRTDTKDTLVQSQLDIQDSQETVTSGVTAPRTNINEFLELIARCSPISDVISQDSIDSGDLENELDSEQDIEEFIINPIKDTKIDKKETDTIKDADVATAVNTCVPEIQEVEKSSEETSARARNSRKYENSSPDRNQELVSCGKSKMTSNETDSENLIVISASEELVRSNTTIERRQSDLFFNASSIGAEDMSYILNPKSDPHELSKPCNPLIEIIDDMGESKVDEIDTSTEFRREEIIQGHNSDNMLFRNKANARQGDKTVYVQSSDNEAPMKIQKGLGQNMKTHPFKNKKCPLTKASNDKVFNKKKITVVRDKNLSINIRKGEKTLDCRKSYLAKKQVDSIKDPENVKGKLTTETKGVSAENKSEKRQVANSNENKLAEIVGHDQKVRSLENFKRKLKENRPSPDAKRMKLNDEISSQRVVKVSQKPKLKLSREVAVNEIRMSNKITMKKKPTFFIEHKDVRKSKKIANGPESNFKLELYTGYTGQNDLHGVEANRSIYQSSDKLLKVSDKIKKLKPVHDKDNTGAKIKRMNKMGNCLVEQKPTENCNVNFDKEPIQDCTINKNDDSLLTKQEKLNVPRSWSNIYSKENEKNSSNTKSETNTDTIEKCADQVLSDVITGFQSSKNEVHRQNNNRVEGHKLFKASLKGNVSKSRPPPKKMKVKRKIHSEQQGKKRNSTGISSNIPKPDNFDDFIPPTNNKEQLSELQDYIENIKKQVLKSFNKDVHEIKYHPNFRPYYRCYNCFDLFFTSQERLDMHNRVSHNIDKSDLVNSENKRGLTTPKRAKEGLENDSDNRDVWSESGNPESVRQVLSTLIVENNSDKTKLLDSKMEKPISKAKTETQQDPKLMEENENPYSICHPHEKQFETSVVFQDICANEGQIESNNCDTREETQAGGHDVQENKNRTSPKNSSANTISGRLLTCTEELEDDSNDADTNQSNYEKIVVSDKTHGVKTSVVETNGSERKTSKEKISVRRNSEKLEINTTEFDEIMGNNRIDRQVPDAEVVSNETKPGNVNYLTKSTHQRLLEQNPSKFESSASIVTNANKTTKTNDAIRIPCLDKMPVQVKTTAPKEGIKTEMKTKKEKTLNNLLKTQKGSKPQHRKAGNSKIVVSYVTKTLKRTRTDEKCNETDKVKEVKEMAAYHFPNDVPEVEEPVESKKYDATKEICNTKRLNKTGFVSDVEKIHTAKERKHGSTIHLGATSKQKEKTLSGDNKDLNGKTNTAEKPKQGAEDGHVSNDEIGHERLFDNDADDTTNEIEKCKIEAKGSIHAKRLLKLSEDSDSNSMRARVDSMSSLDSLTSYLEFETDINWDNLTQEEMLAEKNVFHNSRDNYRQNEKLADVQKKNGTPTSYSKEKFWRFSDEGKYEKCKHCKSIDTCSHFYKSDDRKRRHNSGSSKASDTQSEKYRSRHRSGSSKGSHKSPSENNDRKSDMHCYQRSPKRSKNLSPSRRHDRHRSRRSRSKERYHDSNEKARERDLKPRFIEKVDRHQNYRKNHCRCDSCRKSSSSRYTYKCLENDREIRREIVSKCKKISQRNFSVKESAQKFASSFRQRIQSVTRSKFKPLTKRRPTLSHAEKGKYFVKIEMDDESSQDSTAGLVVNKSVTESSENRPVLMESSSKENISESASEVNDSLGKVNNTIDKTLDIKQKMSTHDLTLCKPCYIKFNSVHDLRRHLYKVHEDVSKCVECKLAFVNVLDYDDHVTEKHAYVTPRDSTIDDSINRRKEEVNNEKFTPSDNRHVHDDETRRRNQSGRNDKPIDYQRFCRICKVEFYTRDELVDHLWDKHRKRVQRVLNEPDTGPRKFTPNAAEYRRPVEGYDHNLTCRICYLRLRSKDELFHHLSVKHNIGPKPKVFSPKGLQRL